MKLATAFPLVSPIKPVLSLEKPNEPEPLKRSTRLIPILRYSPPNLNMWLPWTLVIRSVTI